MAFTINLYISSSDTRTVTKTTSSAITLTGTLRDESSVINPVVDIAYDYSSLVNYNYAYISTFNRYYFIRNIVLVRTGLIRLELECDVLSTYWSQLKGLTGIVSRSSSNFDSTIVDKKLPLKYGRYTYSRIYESPFNTSYNNVGFSLYVVVSNPTNLSNRTTAAGSGSNENPYPSPTLCPWRNGTISVYKLSTKNSIELFYQTFLTDTTKVSEIIAMYLAPIEFLLYGGNFTSVSTITVGNTSIDASAQLATLEDSSSEFTWSQTINKPALIDEYSGVMDWITYSPYFKFRIYIPYYGWVDISRDMIVDDLIVKFAFDLVTGTCKFVIFCNDIIICTDDFDFTVNLPITYTNAADMKRTSAVNNIKALSTVISSFFNGITSTGTNLASGAVAGAVIGGVSTIAEGVSNAFFSREAAEILNVDSGGVTSMGDSFTKLYTPYCIIAQQNFMLPLYKSDYLYSIDDTLYQNYINTVGRPLMKSVVLGDLTGYTEVSEIHLDIPNATANELNRLESIIKTGFFI